MPGNVTVTPDQTDRMRIRIAENVRTELARVLIPHHELGPMLGLHRAVAARRYTGDVAYYAYEIAFLAAVLNIPVSTLLDCGLRPTTTLQPDTDRL